MFIKKDWCRNGNSGFSVIIEKTDELVAEVQMVRFADTGAEIWIVYELWGCEEIQYFSTANAAFKAVIEQAKD